MTSEKIAKEILETLDEQIAHVDAGFLASPKAMRWVKEILDGKGGKDLYIATLDGAFGEQVGSSDDTYPEDIFDNPKDAKNAVLDSIDAWEDGQEENKETADKMRESIKVYRLIEIEA